MVTKVGIRIVDFVPETTTDKLKWSCLSAIGGGDISVRDIQLLKSQPPEGCQGRAEACTHTAKLYDF
jgi:hypothetical protein